MLKATTSTATTRVEGHRAGDGQPRDHDAATALDSRLPWAPPSQTTRAELEHSDREALRTIPGAERFELREALGAGGQGTVFRAVDRETGRPLAIKVFHRAERGSFRALKEEFRSLSRLRHPGLVRLHELHIGGDHGFFTMELLDGVDIKTHFGRANSAERRDDLPSRRWNRVRLAVTQLALAIGAVHEAGLLHLDIKPSNVFVTKAGRVVLLDFGLVRRAGHGRFAPFGRGGTPSYMAPEQLCGWALSEKTDLYSFGVVLHCLLVGKLPAPLGLAADERVVRSDAILFPADVPEDLAILCRDLLSLAPEQRPSGHETLARLAAVGRQHDRLAPPFVGRQSELRELESAFVELDGGGPVTTTVVSISGPAGIGKTTLVRRFLDGLESESRGRSFTGRCFEGAMIPYRLIDELMDRLSEGLDWSRSTAHLAHLGRLFPSFLRRQGGALAPPELDDTRRFLTHATLELAEVVEELAEGKPLVLWLDDVHWSDEDSVPVLLEILTRVEAPLMLILTGREDEQPGTLSSGIDALAHASPHLVARRFQLRELPASDATRLAAYLWPNADDSLGPAWLRAGGTPLQIVELARHALEEDPPSPAALANGELLERLYIGRLARLDPTARGCLELVALAEQPLPSELLELSAPTPELDAALDALSKAALIRIAEGRIEPAHATVRQCVQSCLAPLQRRDSHRALAEAYRTHDAAAHEVLAFHLEHAGELAACIGHLLQGAEMASSALAFARAGLLYDRAYELLGACDEEQRRILERGRELARARLQVLRPKPVQSEAQSSADTPRLMARRALECHMLSGHFEQAEPKLRVLLAEVGLPVFESELSALRGCLVELVQLMLSGLPTLETTAPTTEQHREQREQLEVCMTALRGYSAHATFRGAVYGLLCLKLARRFGEPRRVVLGIVHVASFLTFANLSVTRRFAQRLLERGAVIAGEDAELRALLHGTSGTLDLFAGRWRSAYEKLTSPYRNGWVRGEFGAEWNLAGQMSLIALDHLGLMGELRHRAAEHLIDGRECGNRMVESESRVWCAMAALAADELEDARNDLRRSAGDAPQLGFLFLHWSMLRVQTMSLLYAGDADGAWVEWSSRRDALQRSGLLTIQFIAVAALELDAQVAAALAIAGRWSSAAARKAIERAARRLSRVPTARGRGGWHAARANLALIEGAPETGIEHLQRAAGEYTRADMLLHARTMALCVALFENDDEQRGTIEPLIRDMGVHHPLRWGCMVVPALRRELGERSAELALVTD